MKFLNIDEIKNYIKNLNEDNKLFFDEMLKKYKPYINNEVLYCVSYETYEIYKKYINCSLNSIRSLDNYELFKISFDDGITLDIYKVEIVKSKDNVYFKYIKNYGFIYINENKLYWIKFIKGRYLKIPLDNISSLHKYCKLEKDFEKYIINKFFIKNEYLEKDLKKEDYILLDKNIDYSKFKTKEELLEYIFKEKPKYNLNRLPFHLSFSLMKLKKYLLDKDFETLYKFCLENKNKTYSLTKINRNGYVYNIIEKFYEEIRNINLTNDYDDDYLFHQYIQNIFYLKIFNINISRKSANKLLKECKYLSELVTLKKQRKTLIVNKKVKELKLPYNYKLIKTTNELLIESKLQKKLFI